MKKHLIPDSSALTRIPDRLVRESWWLEADTFADDRPQLLSNDRKDYEVTPCP